MKAEKKNTRQKETLVKVLRYISRTAFWWR